MTAWAYYNEFDPYAAEWLRNLMAAGHIPAGEVDTRSITDVEPADLRRFRQCHFFAGIGGWSLAARLAGWPDDRELWTGSAPCQPFSVAGQGKAQADDRHLWPHLFRLASARRPAVLMGEQVAAAVGKDWLDGVFADLEGIGYACGAAVVPACAVDAPHRRDRLWFVAHADHAGLEGFAGDELRAAQGRRQSAGLGSPAGVLDGPARCDACGTAAASCGCFPAIRTVAYPHSLGGQVDPNARGCAHGSGSGEVAGPGGARDGAVAHAHQLGASTQREQPGGQLGGAGVDQGACAGHVADANRRGREPRPDDASAGHGQAAAAEGRRSAWYPAGWIIGHDGKARRVEPGIRLLAHGVPARVGKLRAYGNAIVPQVAAEVIGAFMDCRP